MNKITLHNTVEVKISKVKKIPSIEGQSFYTKNFEFKDINGNRFEITAFADEREFLKSK